MYRYNIYIYIYYRLYSIVSQWYSNSTPIIVRFYGHAPHVVRFQKNIPKFLMIFQWISPFVTCKYHKFHVTHDLTPSPSCSVWRIIHAIQNWLITLVMEKSTLTFSGVIPYVFTVSIYIYIYIKNSIYINRI